MLVSIQLVIPFSAVTPLDQVTHTTDDRLRSVGISVFGY